MKKGILWIIFLLSAVVFVASAVDGFTKFLSDTRNTAPQSWWGTDKFKYGDLYGMTYLPWFRVSSAKTEKALPQLLGCAANTNKRNIYAMSDSYTWDIFKNPANFCNVCESKYAASNFKDILPVHFNTARENILVIETVERNVRSLLTDTTYLQNFIHILKPGEQTTNLATKENRKKFHFNFRNKDHEANYEFNIWDYRFLTSLKELKAQINYKWFNRTAPDALVANDGKFLLLKSTVDTAFTESSFKPISDAEIEQLVNNLNRTASHYKSLGFKQVYLAIIPNPVTILYPNYNGFTYNQLIPRIQSNPNLKLKVFDSYGLFNNYPAKQRLYTRSDTHWTIEGRDLWFKAFNKVLNNQ